MTPQQRDLQHYIDAWLHAAAVNQDHDPEYADVCRERAAAIGNNNSQEAMNLVDISEFRRLGLHHLRRHPLL